MQTHVSAIVIPLCVTHCECMFNTTCTPGEETGISKRSLDCIEKAAFFIILNDQQEGMLGDDPAWSLDHYAKSLLHGKCYDRKNNYLSLSLSLSLSHKWFDNSVVVFKNGKNGLNAKHSWADAPVFTLATDAFHLGYDTEGNYRGEVEHSLPPPQHLNWDIPPE
ncbi:hypothetical protein P4O66_007791, partial [Electrophorus voltai]